MTVAGGVGLRLVAEAETAVVQFEDRVCFAGTFVLLVFADGGASLPYDDFEAGAVAVDLQRFACIVQLFRLSAFCIVLRDPSCHGWQLKESTMARMCMLRRQCRLVRGRFGMRVPNDEMVGGGFIMEIVYVIGISGTACYVIIAGCVCCGYMTLQPEVQKSPQIPVRRGCHDVITPRVGASAVRGSSFDKHAHLQSSTIHSIVER